MTSNKYIHELDLDWDLDYIRNLTLQLQYSQLPGRATHHRNVDTDEYLSSIQRKLPMLSRTWNVYTLFPDKGVEPHIDGGRKCAINIPVKNYESSATIFYKKDQLKGGIVDTDRILQAVEGDLDQEWQFTLTMPTLVNTHIPHSVEVWGAMPRVIFSWTVTDLDFESAKTILLDYQR
jgi:hypothetical protein